MFSKYEIRLNIGAWDDKWVCLLHIIIFYANLLAVRRGQVRYKAEAEKTKQT